MERATKLEQIEFMSALKSLLKQHNASLGACRDGVVLRINEIYFTEIETVDADSLHDKLYEMVNK